jgi:hypothetical protein
MPVHADQKFTVTGVYSDGSSADLMGVDFVGQRVDDRQRGQCGWTGTVSRSGFECDRSELCGNDRVGVLTVQ